MGQFTQNSACCRILNLWQLRTAVHPPSSSRLQALPRRSQGIPPDRFLDTRPPGSQPHRWYRAHHRPSRTGHLQRSWSCHRSGSSWCHLQQGWLRPHQQLHVWFVAQILLGAAHNLEPLLQCSLVMAVSWKVLLAKRLLLLATCNWATLLWYVTPLFSIR